MTSPFGRIVVIADPTAGDGRTGEALPEIERSLTELGLAHELLEAGDPQEVTALAGRALASGARFLVAAGDDGTVQDVVNGMFEDGRPVVEDPVLGVVPGGAPCDLLKTFGLPLETARACGRLAGDNVYPMDLIKITVVGDDGEHRTRYATNLAEAGFGGAVARRLPRGGSAADGRRRFVAFWTAYVRSRPVQVHVEADRKMWDGRAFNVIVGNGQFTSGGMRMSPRSFPGDGVLDTLIFAGPRSDAYTLLPRIYRHGDHIPDPNIHEQRAKIRVSVDAERPLPVVADGRYLGETPAVFQVVPRQILFKT